MADVEVITAKQLEEFERMLLEHPDMKRKVKKVLSSVLNAARTRVSKDAKGAMDTDPRQAYRAVKRTVYKRMLGGSVSILSKRRAGNTRVRIEHERKVVTDKNGQHRGGNRMARSERTEQLDGYFGSDRGFILRFLNAGTGMRTDSRRNGNRGSITARNWFAQAGQKEMEVAAEQFCQLMDVVIRQTVASEN